MIYTVTFNPALDYIMNVENLNLGLVNRSSFSEMECGGKGFNVSRMLTNLGADNIALGFIGGYTGEIIKNILEYDGVTCDLTEISANTRINVKLRHGKDTEINASGAEINSEALDKLITKITKLGCGDTLVLAGSVPVNVSNNVYEILGNLAKSKGARVVVDATCELLFNALNCKPFLIKPNVHEVEEIFNIKINSQQELVWCAKKLQKMGAENVLVSCGGDGAFLLCCDGTAYTCKAPLLTPVYTVGSGDSMVAGFIYGYDTSGSFEKALKWGIACGSATASSEKIGARNKVEKIYKSL